MAASDSRISPTAHYTSYVWVKNELSPPALASALGRNLYRALWPAMTIYRRVIGRPDLEAMLLARHRCIDERLSRAIAEGRVGQVIEIAAGFSGRGLRFTERYPSLTYFEADLPAQAAEKRLLLDNAGLRRPHHEVVSLDARVNEGDASLAGIAARLDPEKGCAVITEGLVGYFDRATVIALWHRIAAILGRFPYGLYLGDINLFCDTRGKVAVEAFRRALEVFARGRVHLHFATPGELASELRQAGFSEVSVHWPGEHLVRVIDAAVSRSVTSSSSQR